MRNQMPSRQNSVVIVVIIGVKQQNNIMYYICMFIIVIRVHCMSIQFKFYRRKYHCTVHILLYLHCVPGCSTTCFFEIYQTILIQCTYYNRYDRIQMLYTYMYMHTCDTQMIEIPILHGHGNGQL